MKAGRELDALIAEKVMGRTNNATYYSNGDVQQGVPKYSTDIADAWLVVEKLRDINSLNTAVKFQKVMQMQIQGNIFHISPFIICLAALKAVGYEMED